MSLTYKCPSCGSVVEFNSASQMMTCSHCGYEAPVEDFAYESEQATEEKNSNLKVYKCSSCGAELITDENTSATFCSFCGNPNLLEDRLTGAASPKEVIPFKINKDQAREAYIGWAKKGILTPKTLRSSATIEKISGMYVPFWLYDYNARADIEAKCTKVRTERRGDTEYIYTDHFLVHRNVEADFQKIPVDASEKMEDGVMDKLEPFDYGNMVKFEIPYLSGYVAEKYNYDAEELAPRVGSRVETYITNTAMETILGYSSTVVVHNDVQLKRLASEYVLMPVWTLFYKFRGKDYYFTMNGETGKIVADRPVDKTKGIVLFILIFVVSFIILFIGGGLIK